MRKYQPLIDYYGRITEILKYFLPHIPSMQVTNAKTYYGSYWRKDNRSSIALSALRLLPVDHEELIDTICHELAHTIFPNHSQMHEVATKHFVSVVNKEWAAKNVHQSELRA